MINSTTESETLPEVNMSEDNQEPTVEQEEAPKIDYKALYEEQVAANEALNAKKEQLLGETKKAKETARRNMEKEYAEKNQEFEKLLRMEQEEKAKLLEEHNAFKNTILNEKINTQAHKLANELKAIPESADIMADLIAKELKQLADENGAVPEAALKTLKHQFTNDDKYKPLLMGNQSNGGGATGAKNSVQTEKVMTRADFDQLPPMRKMEFMKNGGRTID